MHTTKLVRCGNSQGIVIPKYLCEHVGMRVGDRLRIEVDAASGTIEVALATPDEASPSIAGAGPTRAPFIAR